MPKTVNMTFGPGKAFVLWMDEAPDSGKPPKYRTCSEKMPGNLMGHLLGRGCHITRLHSIAIGKKGNFAMSYELSKGGGDALWDLQDYQRLHHLLQDVDRDKRNQIQVAMGANPEDFFVKTDHSMHCPNTNCSFTDEVEDMGRSDVKMVAIGMDGCGLILSKSDGLLDHIRAPSNYPTLLKDMKKHGKVQGKERKIVCPITTLSSTVNAFSKLSVALNPFTKDEYFVAFEDGVFCYNSDALGGHCEPPPDDGTIYVRTAKDPTRNPTPPEIAQGQAFDRLMKEWGVNTRQNAPADSSFNEWEIPNIDTDADEDDEAAFGSSHDWGTHGHRLC